MTISPQPVPEVSPDPAPAVVIPLRSLRRERAQLVQKLQHAFPAVGLFVVGLQGILGHERGLGLALAVAEVAVSAVLFRFLAQAFVADHQARRAADSGHGGHAGHGHGHGIDWVDVGVAGVLVVEVLEHWVQHHHLQRPTLLLAAVTLALGLFHGRLKARTAHRRSLRIGADGIQVKRRFRGRFAASWQDIERIDVGERWASIEARGGRRRRIDLKDLANRAEVRAALVSARERLVASSAEAPA